MMPENTTVGSALWGSSPRSGYVATPDGASRAELGG